MKLWFNRKHQDVTSVDRLTNAQIRQVNQPNANTNVSGSLSEYDAHEQLLVEKVIKLLKTCPDNFSSRWFTGESLDRSVISKDKKILIMIYNGQIIQPVEPIMSKEQMDTVKQLIAPIVKKDSNYLIERLVCN